jgi:hypothetical protein
MPQVGFKTTIPVSERAKTVRAFEREATVIGLAQSDWIRCEIVDKVNIEQEDLNKYKKLMF